MERVINKKNYEKINMNKILIYLSLIFCMVSLVNANDFVIPGYNQTDDIIITLDPINGSNVNQPFVISGILNVTSTCDLYINNKKEYTNENILGFSNQVSKLEKGEHEYFIACTTEGNDNNSYYEVSDIRTINVESPQDSTIQFLIQSNDFNVKEKNLFMVTPCLEEGIVIWGSGRSKYSMINNPDVYISPLENNIATFELQPGEKEFCLINGIAQYSNTSGYSSEWYINQAEKQIQVGNFNVGIEENSAYGITVSNQDIYNPYDPRAWGTSWVSIIGSLLSVIIGLGLIIGGATMKINGAVLGGVVLVLAGLGYQASNLIIGVIG